MTPEVRNRVDFLPVPQKFNLAIACNMIAQCFGRKNYGVFLVGSSLERRDYRDVDVRCILDDAEFDRLFPRLAPTKGGEVPVPQHDATWSLVCASISLWLQHHSGLPVDFQIQRMTQANEEFKDKRRNGIGLYYADPHDDTAAIATSS